MFFDGRVDLKKSRDYSFLNASTPSKSEKEDEDWEFRNGGAGRSSQDRGAGTERGGSTKNWGGFFGSKPEKSAAERLAELRQARERIEQEKARKELEKLKADRIAASKKASVSGSASGTPQRQGASSAGSKRNDVMQKVQELEKHSRAQMLKQARDFSDLLGNGAPTKSPTPGQRTLGAADVARRSSETVRQTDSFRQTEGKVPQNVGQKPYRKPEAAVKASKAPIQRARSASTPRPSEDRNGRREGNHKMPTREAPSKGGLAISKLATITADGSLVANRGLSLEEAKRLKKGAKLLGLKLYFETDDKVRLKGEKVAQERRVAGKGGALSGRPVDGKSSGTKSNGGANGGVPRSLDEERRRVGGSLGQGGALPRKASAGGMVQSGGGMRGSAGVRELDPAKSSGSAVRERASGRGEAFPPFRGPVKRKRPEEEMEDADSFLDEGEDEDEEGPSQEAVSSMIRKMFRYDPHKYVADDRDDPMMEVGFKRMQAEEARSARIAREEDEREAERLELEERRREEKKRKKAGSKARFVDD